MANEQNLRAAWQKGESGNPSGRPKGSRNRANIIREILESAANDGQGGQVVDQLTRALVNKALSGNVAAYRELMDGAYGKVSEKAEVKTYTKMGSIMVHTDKGPQKLIYDVGSPVDDYDDE